MPKKQINEPKIIINKQRGAICNETMKTIGTGDTCLYYPATGTVFSKESTRFQKWDNRYSEVED